MSSWSVRSTKATTNGLSLADLLHSWLDTALVLRKAVAAIGSHSAADGLSGLRRVSYAGREVRSSRISRPAGETPAFPVAGETLAVPVAGPLGAPASRRLERDGA